MTRSKAHLGPETYMTIDLNAPATPDELLAIAAAEDQDTTTLDKIIRDPNTGRIISPADISDAGLNVRFELRPVKNKLATHRNGGIPVYRDAEYIVIIAPGFEKLFTSESEVTDNHKFRFPYEYEAFKKNQSTPLNGIPLALWGAVTPAQIKELEYHGIRSVEQVASLSDTVADTIRGFHALKNAAKQFIEASRDTAAANHLQAQLDEVKSAARGEIDALKDQVAQLLALNEAAEKAKAKK